MYPERVFSGMRPTGRLHLGHYHGVLKNWIQLQSEYPCYFCVVDWHALTTHYETPEVIEAREHVARYEQEWWTVKARIDAIAEELERSIDLAAYAAHDEAQVPS